VVRVECGEGVDRALCVQSRFVQRVGGRCESVCTAGSFASPRCCLPMICFRAGRDDKISVA
jgi:hypothetical protein